MRKILAVSLVFCLASSSLLECAAAAGPFPAVAPLPQDYPSNDAFSPEQMDNLVAPIALYPDPLLAQVLLASTFVDQVDEAARFLRANYDPQYIDSQPWDVSVKAVAHYPSVLYMMADKIDWTTALGQAYVNQSSDVMRSIQRLRRMAYAQGNLVTTPQQQVIVEPEYIQVVPAQPRVVYVPVYDPGVVYVQRRPFWGTVLITFGAGLMIGAWLNHDCDWRSDRVYYHGWRGGGWVGRSRPVVNITNVYVNNNYTNININRTVVRREVNYNTINRYNSVHRDVRYDNLPRGRAVGNPHFQVNNKIIDRNINTNDPKFNRFRGYQDNSKGNRPGPAYSRVDRPAPAPPLARPVSSPGPHAFGRSEGGFDARSSSSRGQFSRMEANRPSRTPPGQASASRPDRGGSDRGRSNQENRGGGKADKGRSDRPSKERK
jgi:hypothetical protein